MKPRIDTEYSPALVALLERTPLTFVDVGGRGSSLTQLWSLARMARYVTCEPDRSEVAGLTARLSDEGWRAVTVVPEALASRPGETTLYLTNRPGMSSLLEPDPAVCRRFPMGGNFDVTGTVVVPAVPLDVAASRDGFADACFLKLDTQGTELDILQSGMSLLQRSVVGVYLETNFRPFYKGQSLFADCDQFLRQQGFSLFMLSRTNFRRAGHREDRFSNRVTAWAHCLYFRELDTVDGLDRPPQALVQLLALALVFAQFDFAMEVLEEVERRLPAADVRGIRDDVENVIATGTRKVIKDARKEGRDERELLVPHDRDHRRN